MKLHQIQRLGLKVLQTALDIVRKVFGAVTGNCLFRQAAACLGGDERSFAAALLDDFRDQLLGVAITINVGGIDEIDAAVERGMKRRQRLLVIHLTPGSADGPRTKTDFTDLAASASKISHSHVSSPCRRRVRYPEPAAHQKTQSSNLYPTFSCTTTL